MRISDWSSDVCSSDLIRVDLPEGKIDDGYVVAMQDAFLAAYLREYGYTDRDAAIEVTDWYVVATMAGARRSLRPTAEAGGTTASPARERLAWFPELGGKVACCVVARYAMRPGVAVNAPALSEERELGRASGRGRELTYR